MANIESELQTPSNADLHRSQSPSRLARNGALLAGLVLAALTIDVSTGQDPERWELLLVQHATSWRPPLLDEAMAHTDDVAEIGVASSLIALSLLFIVRRARQGWRDLGTLWLFVAGSAVLVHAIKDLVDRTRPGLPAGFGETDSFPSGHTMAAAAVTLFVIQLACHSRLRRGLKTMVVAGCLGLLLIVAYSRIYVGAHYPTDVLASILGAGAWLYTCVALRRKVEQRSGRPALQRPSV